MRDRLSGGRSWAAAKAGDAVGSGSLEASTVWSRAVRTDVIGARLSTDRRRCMSEGVPRVLS